MKESTRIYNDLTATLEKIRDAHRELSANEPITVLDRKLSPAEQAENSRRADCRAHVSTEITRLEVEATRLRRDYSTAMAAEQVPPAPPESQAVVSLRERKSELENRASAAREKRTELALAANTGDAAAKKQLDKASATEFTAIIELENIDLALTAAHTKQREERLEFAERQADEALAVAKDAAAELVAWAEKFDNLLGYVAAHFDQLAELRTRLMKAGAEIDTMRTNMAFSNAARTRAAKAAGLGACLDIDSTVTATPLGPTFKSLLNLAVRRPQVKETAA